MKLILAINHIPLLYLALLLGVGFGLCAVFPSTVVADVKVRSYDRGSETKRSLNKNSRGGQKSIGTSSGAVGGGLRPGRPAPEDDFEPGEILVSGAPSGFVNTLASLNLELIERITIGKLGFEVLRLKLPADKTVKKMVQWLTPRYPASTFDANHRFDLSATSTRSRFPRQVAGWGQATATCGKGVRIGMIDGAVDLDNPALAGQDLTYKSFHDITRNPADTQHGTAIATLLIGKPMRNGWSGLLPGAQLFAASMFEIDRMDNMVGNSGGLLKALNWLAENDVKIININIAGANNKTVASAIKKARRHGMVLIAPVGNWGFRDKAAYPAAYRDVVAVTAVGRRNRVYAKANQGRYVDFAAPGEGVWVPVGPKGHLGDGTSYAAPYISVLAGMRVAEGVRADPKVLRRSLRRDVVDLGKLGRDNVYGWGMVKARPFCAGGK